MNEFNRIANVNNRFQGKYKRVLCVCSAGLLRSPTAALVLSSAPFNFNTRAVGCVSEYALIPVDRVLLSWADEIVCMENSHVTVIQNLMEEYQVDTKIVLLNILDSFEYRNEELQELIKERYSDRT